MAFVGQLSSTLKTCLTAIEDSTLTATVIPMKIHTILYVPLLLRLSLPSSCLFFSLYRRTHHDSNNFSTFVCRLFNKQGFFVDCFTTATARNIVAGFVLCMKGVFALFICIQIHTIFRLYVFPPFVWFTLVSVDAVVHCIFILLIFLWNCAFVNFYFHFHFYFLLLLFCLFSSFRFLHLFVVIQISNVYRSTYIFMLILH